MPSWSSTKKPTISTTVKSTPFTSTMLTTIIQRPTRVTTLKPTTITTPTQKPEKPCQHGQYYPYPDSCTNFLVCVNGHLVSQQCGPGLNWNIEKNMCDWAFKHPCVEKPHKNALMVEDTSVPVVSS